MQGLIIGRYVPGKSLIHQMDPRSKLVIVSLFVFVVFLANNAYSYALLGLFTIAIILLTRIPLYYIINGLKPILLIIIFTFFVHLFMTKEGELLFELGTLDIYEGGLIQGIYISLRLLFLILMTTILTLTTTPIEVTDGMESLLQPLKRFKFPVHELSLMMSISLRFIPTLMQETEKIVKAQTARGMDFRSGPVKDRLNAIVPLLVPLFISAFKRAEELATAMEARGYRGGEGRTKLRVLQWKFIDTIMLGLLILLAIGLFFLRS
ncbi:energy-coupling factor transporter transmembrane component T family protein [Bacillus sp. PS06]|uniref:energy-coupling factor transporter transmembrane component T family protein n=1 Tax=Bacillus sp. PS06 TaxID=2764176 RepID=UPI0017819C50|nr:energy-coupling factor transporter transmembrane protein EcfT [Bacillus sp. PS06]MBD8070920.1 energy-coupling factor transporter transmembrane protein EcfT [Bacillus sp. PS06]